MADHPQNRRLALQLEALVGDELPAELADSIRHLQVLEEAHGTERAMGVVLVSAMAALVFAGELDYCRALLLRAHTTAGLMAQAAGSRPIDPCQGRA